MSSGRKAAHTRRRAVTTVKAAIHRSAAHRWRTWINALRGTHWAKNLLLFLPLLLSHNLAIEPVLRTTAGFVLYGFCASGLYILNDLLDLHSDREHPWKKERPFAAGELSISWEFWFRSSFSLLAFGLGFLLDLQFGFALAGYARLTMLYSLYLKKIALLDVFVLSSFYSFRILAGALISARRSRNGFWHFPCFSFLVWPWQSATLSYSMQTI